MTFPGRYPAHPTSEPPQRGLYPLRPLRVGEILGAAVRITRRSLGLLALPALVVAALGTGVEVALLAATGRLSDVASGSYASLPTDPTQAQLDTALSHLGAILLAMVASLVIVQSLTPLVAGFAAPFVAQAALTTTPTLGHTRQRLRGRWPVLIGSALLAGLAISVGMVVLIVPGILLWVALVPAGPVAAMEGSSPVATFRRSLELTRGQRGRIFGVQLLTAMISGVTALLVASVLGSVLGGTDDTTRSFVIAQALGVLVSGFTGAWSASVSALLYVDLRMRKEDLARALAAAPTV